LSIHLNWVAAERADALPLLEELGLREVGAWLDELSSAYAYTVTPQGWLVLAGASMKLKLETVLPALSAQRPILAGEVSETVMVSSLQAWGAGARLWSVLHEAGKEEDLAISGEPPAGLTEIRARLAAQQANGDEDVDYMFDAPLELGERTCGYRPDRPQPGPWIQLAPATAGTGPVVSALPAAIRAELLPALAERGWTVAPVLLPANGHLYDASRIRDGRLQALRYLWRDDRRDLEIVPSFAVLEGEAADGRVLCSAGVHRDPPTLFQRAGSWARSLGQPAKPYEQLVREAVAAEDPTVTESAIAQRVAMLFD
jgi:hypothetical protein